MLGKKTEYQILDNKVENAEDNGVSFCLSSWNSSARKGEGISLGCENENRKVLDQGILIEYLSQGSAQTIEQRVNFTLQVRQHTSEVH